VEYVDLDHVLSNYIDEYMARKQKNQKNLTKHFVKFFQEQEGIFNTDEVNHVCSSVIPEDNPFAPHVIYPGEVTYLRAFLFALTTQNNSFDISNKNFLKGASRFGIDSPYPTVSRTLYLYRPDVEIEEPVKASAPGGEQVPAQATSTSAQKNTPQKNVVIGIQNMKMLDPKKKQTRPLSKQAPKSKTSSVNFGVVNDEITRKESTTSVLGKFKYFDGV
jgi:hypothetical protein